MRGGRLQHTPFIAEQIVTRRQYGPISVFSARPGRPSLDNTELKVGSVLYSGHMPQVEIGRVVEIDKMHSFSQDNIAFGVLDTWPRWNGSLACSNESERNHRAGMNAQF
jgi:hypothetical protein